MNSTVALQAHLTLPSGSRKRMDGGYLHKGLRYLRRVNFSWAGDGKQYVMHSMQGNTQHHFKAMTVSLKTNQDSLAGNLSRKLPNVQHTGGKTSWEPSLNPRESSLTDHPQFTLLRLLNRICKFNTTGKQDFSHWKIFVEVTEQTSSPLEEGASPRRWHLLKWKHKGNI